MFETVVTRCIAEDLVSGQRLAVDASLIEADTNRQNSTPKKNGNRTRLILKMHRVRVANIWWDFVSSSKERIEQAKQEWRSAKFDIVPGDVEDFIPLPGR